MLIFPFFSDNKNIKIMHFPIKYYWGCIIYPTMKHFTTTAKKNAEKPKKTDFSFISLTILTCVVIVSITEQHQ